MTPTHNKNRWKAQSRAADNKAYRAMQSLYANCMVKSKAAQSDCLHVNEKRNEEFNCHKTFASFSAFITATN